LDKTELHMVDLGVASRQGGGIQIGLKVGAASDSQAGHAEGLSPPCSRQPDGAY
jgi:hypothetical protein